MGTTSTALLWVVSRGLVLWLFFGPHSWVTGDVAYFADSLTHLGERGLGATLVEYPLPGLALVGLPWLLAQWIGHPDVYSELVLGLALVTDAAFTVLLHRSASARMRAGAVGVWLLAVPLLGATTYARFDLVPGVLAGVALLLMVVHARAAAVAAVLATGLKLWPALLLPALVARASGRRAVLATVAVVGAGLVAGSLFLAGWARLVSPLTWQADRGLQIEAVAATPAMVAWGFGPGAFTVFYSEFNAYEVSGPSVHWLLTLTGVLPVVVAGGLLTLWVRAWRGAASSTPDAVAWSCLAAVSAFMVTSKVLSPQYLLWLLPLAAAALAVSRTDRGQRQLRRWAVVLLVATSLTQLVFPVYYGHLTQHDPSSYRVVLLLAVRNAVLVWLTIWASHEAWWHLQWQAQRQRGAPLDRQPPGPEGSDARTLR
jgi:hypothetical protein